MGRYTPGDPDDWWGYLLSAAPTDSGIRFQFTVGAGPALPQTVLVHSAPVVVGRYHRVAIAFNTTLMTLCVDGNCHTHATKPAHLAYQIDSRFVLGGPSVFLEVDELWICKGDQIQPKAPDPPTPPPSMPL